MALNLGIRGRLASCQLTHHLVIGLGPVPSSPPAAIPSWPNYVYTLCECCGAFMLLGAHAVAYVHTYLLMLFGTRA